MANSEFFAHFRLILLRLSLPPVLSVLSQFVVLFCMPDSAAKKFSVITAGVCVGCIAARYLFKLYGCEVVKVCFCHFIDHGNRILWHTVVSRTVSSSAYFSQPISSAMSGHGDLFKEKMVAAGLSEAFCAAFLQVYNDLVAGKTGMMSEDSITPADGLPYLKDLPEDAEAAALLGETVMLKLNGGLGTGMGLDKAKSLLEVKGNDTFLDFIAKQVRPFFG